MYLLAIPIPPNTCRIIVIHYTLYNHCRNREVTILSCIPNSNKSSFLIIITYNKGCPCMLLTILLFVFLYLFCIGITFSILHSFFRWYSDEPEIYLCSAFCIITLPILLGTLLVRFLNYRIKH